MMTKKFDTPTTMVTEKVWDDAIAADPDNLDLKYAKSVFYGVSDEHIRERFSKGFLGLTDDLFFIPDNLFNYYFHHFNEFVLSKEYDAVEAVAVADCYLHLVEKKLDRNAIDNSHPIEQTRQTLNYIEENISFFNTEPEIYGDLSKKVSTLQKRLTPLYNQPKDLQD